MIVSSLLTILVLALSLWIAVMYVWWKKEYEPHEPPATIVAETYAAKGARLGRRGWYIVLLHLRYIGRWIGMKLQNLFFRVFPNAKPAFIKQDTLAGLTDGPSSYFLRTISEKPAPIKRTSKKLFS